MTKSTLILKMEGAPEIDVRYDGSVYINGEEVNSLMAVGQALHDFAACIGKHSPEPDDNGTDDHFVALRVQPLVT